MPIYKVTETVLGEIERVRVTYVDALDKEEALDLIESGNVTHDEETEKLIPYGTFYKAEEIRTN